MENEELVDGEEVAKIRREAELLEAMSEKLIPSLFKLVENIHAKQKVDVQQMEVEGSEENYADKSHKVRSLADAIASLSQLAPQHLIQRLFSKVVQRLLEASQADEDLSEQMCMLLTLSQALVVSESLEHTSISLLFRCLKPLIRSDETKPRVQKRAYKVLAEICQHRADFVQKSEQLDDTLQLLTSSLQTSQVSSLLMRIKCLTIIVDSLDNPNETEKVGPIAVCFCLCLTILNFQISYRNRF